jgi:hypothetical protein
MVEQKFAHLFFFTYNHYLTYRKSYLQDSKNATKLDFFYLTLLLTKQFLDFLIFRLISIIIIIIFLNLFF